METPRPLQPRRKRNGNVQEQGRRRRASRRARQSDKMVSEQVMEASHSAGADAHIGWLVVDAGATTDMVSYRAYKSYEKAAAAVGCAGTFCE